MVDMAMLLAEHKPDPEGHVIPSNIQEGSAQFASARGRNQMMTLVIAADIYNVSTATCGSGCTSCCGSNNNFTISPDPIYCPLGGTMAMFSNALDCNGYTIWPSWSSSNSSVMTVDSSNNVHGISLGQATITANRGEQIEGTGPYQVCGGQSCSLYPQQTQAPAQVVGVDISEPLYVSLRTGSSTGAKLGYLHGYRKSAS